MSAWIVSKQHIDALVTAVRTHADTVISQREADEIGAMLWAENHKAVNIRYHERNSAPRYAFVESTTIDPVTVVKAIDYFHYQCAEYDGWDESEAYVLTAALRGKILRTIASYQPARRAADACDLPGYDAAPWGL